jgi:hypothetical protein
MPTEEVFASERGEVGLVLMVLLCTAEWPKPTDFLGGKQR